MLIIAVEVEVFDMGISEGEEGIIRRLISTMI